MKNKQTFQGFESPNTTPVPDVIFDELLRELTGNELKVLLYIVRRTFGFKKNADAISLSQFREGITTREGKVLDKGCGVEHNRTILAALTSLEEKGYIVSTKRMTSKRDNDTTVYMLHFKGYNKASAKAKSGGGSLPEVTTGSYLGSRRVVTSGNTQATVKQQTVIQDKDTTQLPNGNVRSNVSFPSQASVKGTNQPPKEKSPRGRQLSPAELQVADAFDALMACPINREDSSVKKDLKYLAGCIASGKASLEDIARVKSKLDEGFWKDKISFHVFASQFSVTLTSLATSQASQSTEPGKMSEEDEMTAWIQSIAIHSGPVAEGVGV